MTDEYTNIRIKKTSKDKMKVLQSVSGLTYSEIIEKLITGMGGMINEDVITIQREQVAFTLNYWDKNHSVKKDVTYHELNQAEIGTRFKPDVKDLDDDFTMGIAEVIAILKDTNGKSLVLKNSQINVENREHNVITNIVHVELF